jgi:hypothetical protein
MTEQEQITRMYMEQIDSDCFVDVSEDIEHPPTALSMGTYSANTKNGLKRFPIPIGTFGNFSFISGQPKTKKTFLVSLLVSVFLSKQGSNKFGGDIRANRGDKCVIHFDTEQSKFHAQRVFRRAFQTNDNDDLGCYHTYGLRPISYKTRIDFIDYKLNQLKEEGKEIGLVIIDGIADLVSDVNHIEESNLVVQKVMTWSSLYDCHILLVVHTNFGSVKATGHLGSFLQKKCETELLLEANPDDENVISVKCNRSRNYSFDTFSFSVDNLGRPFVLNTLNDVLDDDAIITEVKTNQNKWSQNKFVL